MFIDAERVIADPPVRNRGTIGGSLAQADAAEDLSAVCSALKAKVVIVGSDGERVVSMEDFHVGPYHDGDPGRPDPDRDPRAPEARRRQRTREGRAKGGGLGHRRGLRRALAGGRPRSRTPGSALSAAGPTTIHATRSEELLRGKEPSEELFAEAGQLAAEDSSPIADGRGPVDYKRHLADVLTRRALSRAAERASKQEG